MEENPLPSPSQPTPPVSPQPSTSPTPSTEPSPAQSGFSLSVQPAASPQSAPQAIPGAPEEALKPRSGKMKWILIGVAVLVIGGTAAGLWYSGILNPAPSTGDLKGAASEQSTLVQPTQETQEQTQQAIDIGNINQIALTACPQGQVMDPVSNRCGCDINNNYFQVSIPGAYSQPAAGQQPTECSTCAQLSDQILTLGQSQDPADATRKSELELVAKENNCTTCAVIDDRISKAAQDKAWDKYFDLVVEKSNDKTCGRALTTCDSLRWQLLFMNDLRVKAGKDTGTAPEMLQTLKQKQLSLEEELGNNSTCYNMESLCTDLKDIFGSNSVSSVKPAPSGIASTPLIGGTASEPVESATQQTQEQTQQQAPEVSSINPDLKNITLDQLFDKEFYMLHCPVDGFVEDTTAAPAPVKVRRVPTPTPLPSY